MSKKVMLKKKVHPNKAGWTFYNFQRYQYANVQEY